DGIRDFHVTGVQTCALPIWPFDSVPATLTLVSSRVRTSATSYPADGQPVVETGGATQSIATSTGLSDAGLFEANLRDERYLPFEIGRASCRERVSATVVGGA